MDIISFSILIVCIILLSPLLLLASLCNLGNPKVGSSESDKKRVLLDNLYITKEHTDKYLPGWEVVVGSKIPKQVDFLFGITPSSYKYELVNATLKARMISSELTDKVKFHKHASTICPKAIARTFEVFEDTKLPDNKVYIVRANWGWKGSANEVIDDGKKLSALYKKFTTDTKLGRKLKAPRVIASEYIMDPHLYKGYKYHTRVHILAVLLASGKRYCVMLPTIELVLAGKPYVANNWEDEDIHDTHERRNSMTTTLDTLESGDILRENTIKVLNCLIPNMLPYLELYPESQNAYELFGVDIMYASDLRAIVLEINANPSIAGESSLMYSIREEIIATIFSTAVKDVFGGDFKYDKLTYLKSDEDCKPKLAGTENKKKVIIDNEFITKDHINKYLPTWEIVTGPKVYKYVDFLFGIAASSRKNERVKAILKARMISSDLTDKVKFHEHALVICPESIAKTFEVFKDTKLPDNKVYMIRANWGWKGMANGVATNNKELSALYKKFTANPDLGRKLKAPRVIASEYIMDPHLYKGYKYHTRIHLLTVLLASGKRYCVMLPTIDLILAGKPYKTNNWSDEDIHDTHGRRNTMTTTLETLESGEILRENTIKVLKCLMPKMLGYLKLYPESKNAYELFGVDIMYTSDLRAIVLEINANPGIDGDALHDVREEIISTIFSTAVKDVFGGNYNAPNLVYL